jgi:hypothetical protein
VALRSARARTSIALLGAAALALAPAAGSSSGARVSFVQTAGRVVQGSSFTATVSAPNGALCALTVRYAGGSRQAGLKPARATAGHVSWSWRVALQTRAGAARMTASCGRLGRAVQTLIVVGQLVPPKIAVLEDGFSVRPHDFGGGSDVSYGVVLRNRSRNADALDVNVLVNFVLPDNRLLGSQSSSIAVLRAGATYALGASMGFPGAAPIARLEVVVQVGGKQVASTREPAVANVVLEPDQSKPQYLGDVAGELINTDAKRTLQNAQLSAVVLDRAGNVVGGGNGSSFYSLPPATRVLFKLTSGFNAIPTANAASALVSVIPSWKQPGR